ncbi:MAG: hypothetical protein EPO20_27590 [Betaproteobacteria bacterium]|nr:MAG: hypothetical protein EPO20_27590 [Betaproteobacteria bacterium]
MLHAILDALWSLGAACSATFVIYGGYLFYRCQCAESVETLHVMAQLALHDSARIAHKLEEVKALAVNR